MSDSVTISDGFRTPIVAEKREDGGVVIRGHFRGIVALSPAELFRLFRFVNDLGVMQHFPPKSPQTDVDI